MYGRAEDGMLEEYGDEYLLDLEMQHILAAAITKILEQKSIRDTVMNLEQLVVNELEEQIKEQSFNQTIDKSL